MFRALAGAGVLAVAISCPVVASGLVATSGHESPAPIAQCQPGYYQNSSGNCVERPDQNPSGGTAICRDGTESHSQSRSGTCSGHGGVSHWSGWTMRHVSGPDRLAI
ncbi:DUF3761 domain-containing protein [Mycobacterium paragordonae]|uniref:DUF3761 domain-containing protein n=1 Tax=Mycobacterium paragordonae TaxID=1389713 RepID=UPI0012E1EC77|nr:DUF3761 domain-containing protein [Mycobacterium paragordonae]